MEAAKIFFLGMLTAIGLILLLGAGDGGEQHLGRYQISAWGAAKEDSYRSGYYVLDTSAGKVVDQSTK
jgi:hypothetical protein